MTFIILYLLISITGLGLTLGFYIAGAISNYYDDGQGISIAYGEKTLLILSVIFLFLVLFGIYMLYKNRKKETVSFSLTGMLLLVIGLILLVFNTGWIIKNYEDLSGGVPQYLLLIIGLCSLAAGLLLLFDKPTQSSNQ